jgi:hypothetical protein
MLRRGKAARSYNNVVRMSFPLKVKANNSPVAYWRTTTTRYVSTIIPITKTMPNSLSTCHMLASDESLLATGIYAGLGD